MEITLRKANQLEHLTLEAARHLRLSTVLTVSVYDKTDLETLLDAGRGKIVDTIKESIALTEAGYLIRSIASVKIHATNIGALLLEKAKTEELERLLASYRGRRTESVETTAEKLRALRSRTEGTSYYGDDTLNVELLSPDDAAVFEDHLARLRARKTAIIDELMQANWENTIVIPDQLVELLRKHKIAV